MVLGLVGFGFGAFSAPISDIKTGGMGRVLGLRLLLFSGLKTGEDRGGLGADVWSGIYRGAENVLGLGVLCN